MEVGGWWLKGCTRLKVSGFYTLVTIKNHLGNLVKIRIPRPSPPPPPCNYEITVAIVKITILTILL